MIFKDLVFQKVPQEFLYKSQMNGLRDPTLVEFQPIAVSCIMKKEFRKNYAEIELIFSYLQSAKILGEKIEQDAKGTNARMVFKKFSLILPTIYLCRHCIELSIKHAISKFKQQPKSKHGLIGLWSTLLQIDSFKLCSEKEKTLLKSMGKFVDTINVLDNNGTRLRYAEQNDGSDSQETFLFVSMKTIISQTESFVNQLELLVVENK